ncbi:LLM class flavin-dependent oxidoreductase [Jatrophihabitans sp. YIM 134969]
MTARPTLSVLYPLQPTHGREMVPFAQLVRDSSARRLWTGQSLHVESHAAFAYLAGAGYEIPVGIAVGLAALRHPYDAALQARSLAALTGQPATIGYGAADPYFVASLHGAPWPGPARVVEEFVTVTRALLAGGPVQFHGRHFQVDAKLPPMAHPPVEIGAGVLRPAMARAAGRVADAAITWLTPPDYLRDTVAPVIAGAASEREGGPRLVAVVHVAVDRPGRHAMLLAQHGAFNHLRAPHYTDMLRRAGLDVDASDPIAGARELVEQGVFVYGKPGDITAELQRYAAAGVDEVVLNTTAVAAVHGMDAAAEDLHDILAEV